MTSDIVFVLGRTPDLAFAELSHRFPSSGLVRIHTHAVRGQVQIDDPETQISQLGGTTAIAEYITSIDDISAESIAAILGKTTSGSVTFGVSTLDSHPYGESFLRQVKKELQSLGISSRYIVNKKSEPLSAVVMKGQKVNEILIIPDAGRYILTRTIAVQNIPQWVKRDFERPHADPKRGMLPPKVARMLVNIVASYHQDTDQHILLDPFCGMGTILAEALLAGWNVVGSDISEEVIRKTKGNMDWIMREYSGISGSVMLRKADAVHISQLEISGPVTAIATEPFMGSTSFALQDRVDPEEIRNTVKGLEKLYIGCLKDWSRILKQDGAVLIALPSFRLNGRELFVKKVIDSCETLGYSVEGGPWTYSRPQAFVERNFYLLRKTGSKS